MKVLFIGGTGVISSACSRLAIEQGIELFHLNRGQRDPGLSKKVKLLKGDIRNYNEALGLVKPHTFDAVVDFIAFTTDHIEADIKLFSGRTKQFIFISSASVYQKPATHHICTESTPLHNPHWEYSRNKIRCEERLIEAYRKEGFPAAIVRPSYTYSEQLIPASAGGGWTIVDRMRKGKKTVVHGDGTSLWTMTHNSDFAKGFNGLLGNQRSLGHAFHITSDEVLTWDQIYQAIASAAGVDKPDVVHIPSDFIAKHDEGMGASLLGDKAWSYIFDNTKIKNFVPGYTATVPFIRGIRKTMEWFEEDKARQTVDSAQDAALDKIVAAFEKK